MDNKNTSLPMMAMDNVPTPTENARAIIGLVKKKGRITGYQLESGEILEKQAAIELARAGGIKGVGIAHRNDTEYLKSLPDGNEDNNLTNLPTVK